MKEHQTTRENQKEQEGRKGYGGDKNMRENPKPLEQVLTFAEATKRWGLGHSTLRESVRHNRFLPGETRKSGGTWLVTEKAMKRLYGEPKGGK